MPRTHVNVPIHWKQTRFQIISLKFCWIVQKFFSFFPLHTHFFIHFTICDFLLCNPSCISWLSNFFNGICTKLMFPIFINYTRKNLYARCDFLLRSLKVSSYPSPKTETSGLFPFMLYFKMLINLLGLPLMVEKSISETFDKLYTFTFLLFLVDSMMIRI